MGLQQRQTVVDMRGGLLALMLMGCGDSLVFGPQLESELGLDVELAEPAWQARWVVDGELRIACEAMPFEDALEDVVAGTDRFPLPDAGPPEWAWNVVSDEFEWALALFVAVDQVALELEDGAVEGDALDEMDGVWGVAEPFAQLFALGEDREEGLEDLVSDPDDLSAEGWVEVFSPLVIDDGRVEGNLAGVEEADVTFFEEQGLPATHRDDLSADVASVWSGAAFDRVSVWGCDF